MESNYEFFACLYIWELGLFRQREVKSLNLLVHVVKAPLVHVDKIKSMVDRFKSLFIHIFLWNTQILFTYKLLIYICLQFKYL